MEVVILAGAESDLFEAWQRFEELVPGLGERFDQSVKSGLARIALHPESAARYLGEMRRLVLQRFDHGIFYRIHGQRIVVTAVLSLWLDPEDIERRLKT
jgi:plasmid stabilization system protein ParE